MKQMDGSSEASLLKMAVVLVRWRRTILFGTLIAMLLTAIVVVVIPVSYTGTALIMTPSSLQSSTSALLSQVGSLASLLPGGLEVMGSNLAAPI